MSRYDRLIFISKLNFLYLGVSANREIKPGRSSDESMLIKRKRIDTISPNDRKVGERNGNLPASKNLTNSEPSKRPKTGFTSSMHQTSFIKIKFFFQESQIHCIVHGCSNWAKSGWVYCSPACIRRHINETLQTIQRSKGTVCYFKSIEINLMILLK
jgi:hypothetical protein